MIRNFDDIPLMFGCKELAEILGVCDSLARTLMHSEGFPAHQISPRKQRIYKGDFLRWLGARNEDLELLAAQKEV